MKPNGYFYFADEPQFGTYEKRSWVANYLRACRNSLGNLGCKRYSVKKVGFGRYEVRLNYSGSPTAVIVTRFNRCSLTLPSARWQA